MRTLILLLISLLLAACGSTSTEPPAPTAILSPPALTQAQPPAVFTLTPAPLTQPAEAASPTALLPASLPVGVSTFPDPAGYTWQPVVAGLNRPLWLTHANDGSGRIFVIEQPGVIRVIRNGQLADTPFLDIRNRVGSQGNEQGLLGLAFHLQYSQNGLFFVNYTDLAGDTVIARFQVSAADPERADPASEKALLRIPQPYGNHNGGIVAFGPDGYLYLGLGDGGSAGDPLGNGQALDTLLGKILRIDVDGGEPYAVPSDNPYAAGGGLPEIWAYGLRNPWRFSFDRLTDDFYVADVGQNLWEEVNFQAASSPAGANFGWKIFEGNQPYAGRPGSGMSYVQPVFVYGHDQGCSVTGGYVYRGELLPAWRGIYLFGDYCTGQIWGLLRDANGAWQSAALFQFSGRIASFGEDQAGELYLVEHGGGIYQLVQR